MTDDTTYTRQEFETLSADEQETHLDELRQRIRIRMAGLQWICEYLRRQFDDGEVHIPSSPQDVPTQRFGADEWYSQLEEASDKGLPVAIARVAVALKAETSEYVSHARTLARHHDDSDSEGDDDSAPPAIAYH